MNAIILGLLAAFQSPDMPEVSQCVHSIDYAMEVVSVYSGEIKVRQTRDDGPPYGIIKGNVVPYQIRLIGLKQITQSNGFADVADYWEECR